MTLDCLDLPGRILSVPSLRLNPGILRLVASVPRNLRTCVCLSQIVALLYT
jgi:hypothetical protein